MAIVTPDIGGGVGACTLVYHYDDGRTTNVSVAYGASVKLKTTPVKFVVGNVTVKFQLFNSYGQNSTSQYGYTSWSVQRFYSAKWSTDYGYNFTGGSTITPSTYIGSGTLNLYPIVDRYTTSGSFGNGPYENTNITITGKANYSGGTDVSIQSSLSRQHVCSNWYDCNGTSINVTPGTTATITLPSSYTYPTSLLIKGLKSHHTEWTTYSSSKSIGDLPSLSARPTTHSYYDVNLRYTGKTARSETLQVDTQHSYTFSHWATDANGTTPANTSTKPTSNTTVYAVWTTSSTVQTKLPTWTTSDYEPDSSSYRENTLVHFIDPKSNYDAVASEILMECKNYPLKHSHWTTSGGNTCSLNSAVYGAPGETYTAVFTLDKTTTGYNTFFPEDVIPHPDPGSHKGYEYLGLTTLDISGGVDEDTDLESIVTYSLGQSIPIEDIVDCGTVFLYMVWKSTIPDGMVRIYNSTTKKMEKYKPIIYNSSTKQWESYLPKIYNGIDWNDIYS